MRIGEWLQSRQRISEEQLNRALQEQQSGSGGPLGQILVGQGAVSEEDVLEALAEQFHAGVLTAISDDMLDRQLVKDLPVDFLRSRPMLPLRVDGRLVLVSPDPMAVLQHAELGVMLGGELEPMLAPDAVVRGAIDRCYAQRSDQPVGDQAAPQAAVRDEGREDLLRVSESAPVASRVNRILLDALEQNASDIHLDPRPGRMEIRYRVDGVLTAQGDVPAGMEDALVSRIKIMADLDIAERRLPQDGNAKVSVGAREVDVRVSSIPVTAGERIVMRLLGRESTQFSLSDLGMPDPVMGGFRDLIRRPHGAIWVTGPTGSGKTTTLYAALQELDTQRRNVLTIEDPVEYQLSNIGQMNVMPRIGLTFATGLRHLLRQDPDVILVGETRDEETAEIVVRSSMTGHLVFSTLHANDAVSAPVRVVDMGVAPYLVAEATLGAMAQRLVRCLCPHCRSESPRLVGAPWAEEQLLPQAVGCSQCREGYAGRVGLFELLTLTPALQEAVREQKSAASLRAMAGEAHYDVWTDAKRKVEQGVTSPEEVIAVLGSGV